MEVVAWPLMSARAIATPMGRLVLLVTLDGRVSTAPLQFARLVASKVHAPFLTLVSAIPDGLASTAVYVRQVGRPLLLDVPERYVPLGA